MRKVRQGRRALPLITEFTVRIAERVRTAGSGSSEPRALLPHRRGQGAGLSTQLPRRRWSKAVSRATDFVHVGQARVLGGKSGLRLAEVAAEGTWRGRPDRLTNF